MGNCLKTQLKENVQNENLVRVGCFMLDKLVPTPSGVYNELVAKNGKQVVIAYYNDNDERQIIVNSNTDGSTKYFTIASEKTRVEVKNYYDLVNMSLAAGSEYDVAVYKFTNGASSIVCNSGAYGKLVNFGKHTSLTNLVLSNSIVEGNVEDLAETQVANGRTEGRLAIYSSNVSTCRIYLNGVKCTQARITFDASVARGYTAEVIP